MNCQPFEDWLLNDKKLTEAEKREMDSHLQSCPRCAAISQTGFALRASRVVSPAPGFVSRFEIRLAAQKIAERRRNLWGMMILLASGVGLIGWVSAPYIQTFLLAPVEWITAGIGYLLYVFTSLQALAEMISIFAKVLPNILPPYAWMMIVSALAGFSLLWTVSIWRFSRAPLGVLI